MARIVRVFPRRTSMTPRDDYAFVGDPPLFLPPGNEVHVDCTFTWDMAEASRLFRAWAKHYPVVKLGGPVYSGMPGLSPGEFVPGLYVRKGVTFTSRGCNNRCPWCLVRQPLFEIKIHPGNNILDNNLLQCSKEHIANVFDMLRSQHGISLSGGLDARELNDSIADDLRSLRIKQLFFACDTKEAIKPLERAKRKLDGFTRNQLRCYVLLAFNNETISQAQERLEAVYELGFMPFAQLYQPPDRYIKYSREWRSLARTWSRPAATKAFMRGNNG